MQLILIIFLIVYVHIAERLQLNICKKSEDDYQACLLQAFEKARPHFLNGVPELDFPGIDPLVINVTSVDRTLNELISIKAVLKNVRVTGLGGVVINDLK